MSEPIKNRSVFPKRCSKCARMLSEVDWFALAYVGEQEIDETESLELRNCNCGSTLSVVIDQVYPYVLP